MNTMPTDTHRFAQDLYYIKVNQNKRPIESGWGWNDNVDDDGNQLPYSEFTNVYSYQEACESPHDQWAWIGHKRFQFFVIDFDWTEIAEQEYADPETAELRFSEPLAHVKSQSCYEGEDGFTRNHEHFIFAYDGDEDFTAAFDRGIDLKGEAGKGYALCPPTPGYEMADEFEMPIFATVDEVLNAVTIDGQQVIKQREHTPGAQGEFTGRAPGSIYEMLSPSEYPEGERRGHPYHASSTGANFFVDSGGETFRCWNHGATGNLMHLIGIKHGVCDCGEWVEKGGLTAEQTAEIYAIAENEEGIRLESTANLERHVPVDEYGKAKVHDKPPETWPTTKPLSLQGIARSGKSYSLVDLVTKAYEDGFNGKVLWGCPSHDEGAATLKKFQNGEFGGRGNIRVAHLVGQTSDIANEISNSGDVPPDIDAITPAQAIAASEQYPDANVYAAYKRNCLTADVIITPPALFDDVNDVDLFVTAEESVISSMFLSEFKLVDAEPSRQNDRKISSGFDAHTRTMLQNAADRIANLERQDKYHTAVATACNALLDIDRIIGEWNPGSWSGVQLTWLELQTEIQERLRQIPVEMRTYDKSKIRGRCDNMQIDELVLSALHYNDTFMYGSTGHTTNEDGQDVWKRERLQAFLCPDAFEPAFDLEGATIWAGASMKVPLDMFHEVYGGEVPDVWAMKSQTEDMVDGRTIVYKYTGGENPNQQTGTVRDLIGEIQALRSGTSILSISGSSEKAAYASTRRHRGLVPNSKDDMEDVMMYAKANPCVCIPVTSRFANGVDTPFFNMGVVEHAFYAMPQIDHISESEGNPDLAAGFRMADAQNAMLRTSNVPGENRPERGEVYSTGDTPVVVPSRHVPNVLFEIVEAFGIEVVEVSDQHTLREKVLDTLKRQPELGPTLVNIRVQMAASGGSEIAHVTTNPHDWASFDSMFGQTNAQR